MISEVPAPPAGLEPAGNQSNIFSFKQGFLEILLTKFIALVP